MSGVQCQGGAAGAGQQWNCTKLLAGANARLPQPWNGRTLWSQGTSGRAAAAGLGGTVAPPSGGLLAGMFFGGVAAVVVAAAAYIAWRHSTRHDRPVGRPNKRGSDGLEAGFEMESTWLRMPAGSSSV